MMVKRLVGLWTLLVAMVLAVGIFGGSLASAAPEASASRAAPPRVVGMKLPAAEEELERHGWIPRPFNTDTVLGIVIKSHYTVCKQYPPIGRKVRILAQKYGC
jgi:hypothetical protein